jgi:3-hydroxybutyryl-CoA dehydrogenase
MKVEEIKRFAVVGAGNMGSQVAQHLAQAGKYEVTLVDTSDELVKRGIGGIRARLQKFFVDKGKMTQGDMDGIMARISGTADLASGVKDADYVIESAFEDAAVKRAIFKQVDGNAPTQAILASNTSTLNITDIANATKRPDKVIGMHFFNPVAMMKLVEVVKGSLSSAETLEVTTGLARKLGKEPVVCNDYSFGFLANRVYDVMSCEAAQLVWERVASPEDIDKALKLGYNLPMGPLELEDMAGGWGLKTHVEDVKIAQLGERGRLPAIIKIMVRAGYTGGPGKKGIYAFYKEVMGGH